VLLVRFLPAIAPEDKTDRHRGANRLPVERKTDAETSPEAARGKAKSRKFTKAADKCFKPSVKFASMAFETDTKHVNPPISLSPAD
jgi:hypothetical protein